jgi:hypothetical protein
MHKPVRPPDLLDGVADVVLSLSTWGVSAMSTARFRVESEEARRVARVVEEHGGGHHEPLEHSDNNLNRVDCSCGHMGSPAVTMAVAYTSQFIHLRALSLQYDVSF